MAEPAAAAAAGAGAGGGGGPLMALTGGTASYLVARRPVVVNPDVDSGTRHNCEVRTTYVPSTRTSSIVIIQPFLTEVGDIRIDN